jgi:hypothetical protein
VIRPIPVVQPVPIDGVPTINEPSSPLLTVSPLAVPPVELLVAYAQPVTPDAPIQDPITDAPIEDPAIYAPKQDRN